MSLLKFSYPLVSLCASALFATLSFCLLFTPELIYWLFDIAGNETADLMSKRAAMLFLGLAMLAFQSRNEPDSALRRTIALGVCTTFVGLAIVGVFEFMRGQAGGGIWLAILGEMIFAILYFILWKNGEQRG